MPCRRSSAGVCATWLSSSNTGPPGLLGLYEGVPLTERDAGYSGVLPDRISIYRLPIYAICATDADVIEQVTITVVHEVEHPEVHVAVESTTPASPNSVGEAGAILSGLSC